MLKRIYAALPGPSSVRVVEAVLLVALALAGVFYLFEWAGDLLDSGGVVGG